MTTKKIPIYLIGAAIIALAGCLPYNLPAPTLIPATDTITLTSTRKPTSMPTFTATPVPTLSPNDVYTRVNEFLTNNSYCRLPCWFGIVPQQSTLIDVQTQLTMFSSISTDISYDLPTDNWVVSTLTIPFTDNNLVIEISSAYLAPLNENNISLNEFSTRAYQLKDGAYNGDVYGSSAYNEHLKAYTLSEILSRYGPPSQIFIRSNLSTDELPLPQYSLDSFVIHIWYPNQGIFMEYSMLAGGSGITYRFCPSNSFISGVLLPTDLGTGYQEVLKRFGGVYPLFFPPAANIKAPEEAFGMTIEEFYQLFRSPTNKCLESPESIWWPK